MQKLIYLLLIATTTLGQPTPKPSQKGSFDRLIQYFQTYFVGANKKKPPLIYEPDTSSHREIRVMLSDSSLNLRPTERLVKVPYTGNPFPVAYSVIYQNRLISLFESGQFTCLTVDGLTRDTDFEKKLNTKRFAYCWLLDDHLIGLADNIYYRFNERSGWIPYTQIVPLQKQPKLYEDANFIAFSTCRGEFGGTLFVYDKRTRLTHFVPSVCSCSIIRKPDGYYMLASLGHGAGHADLTYIRDPTRLPIFSKLDRYGNAIADSTRLTGVVQPTVVFDYLGLELFGSFTWKGRQTYLANWAGRTFLAEIANNTLFIKDPLFNDGIYTHNPITTQYGNVILINLDFYGLGGECEVACLLIRDNRVTKVSWNKTNTH